MYVYFVCACIHVHVPLFLHISVCAAVRTRASVVHGCGHVFVHTGLRVFVFTWVCIWCVCAQVHVRECVSIIRSDALMYTSA